MGALTDGRHRVTPHIRMAVPYSRYWMSYDVRREWEK